MNVEKLLEYIEKCDEPIITIYISYIVKIGIMDDGKHKCQLLTETLVLCKPYDYANKRIIETQKLIEDKGGFNINYTIKLPRINDEYIK